MKILVLSNVNLEPVKPFLSDHEIDFTSYNDYMIHLIDQKSKAYQDNHDIVQIYLDGDELVDSHSKSDKSENVKQFFQAVSDFSFNNPGKILLLNTISLNPFNVEGHSSIFSTTSYYQFERDFNDQLIELARKTSNIALLDSNRIFGKYGYKNLISLKFWYLGRIKYNDLMFEVLADQIQSLLQAYFNRSKKVLVLDLDNTLWGGVIGENGLTGIKLSEDGIGKIYRDFQKEIKKLKDQGVILAVNSKNNEADALEVFKKHRMMSLDWDDFVIKKINWENKYKNILEIAGELNVGLDSLVFIDDNPVEREIITANIPEVTVPDFPCKKEELPTWFLEDVVQKYFPKYKLTKEDLNKTKQYQAQIGRNTLKESTNLNIEEFLKNLEIKLEFFIDSAEYTNRAAQMCQKTNQFNVTTRRYSVADIESYMKDSDYRVILMEYRDKFGKEGIVGLTILNLKEQLIDSFIMSCRVIGRNAEKELLKTAEKEFKTNSIKKIKAHFVSTKKNKPSEGFYGDNGFIKSEMSKEDIQIFEKELK